VRSKPMNRVRWSIRDAVDADEHLRSELTDRNHRAPPGERLRWVAQRVVDDPYICSPQRRPRQLTWPVGDLMDTLFPTSDNRVGGICSMSPASTLGEVPGQRALLA
jgi:hypothetical protein